MAELASSPLSLSDMAQSCLASSRARRPQKDVRSRRVRRPADYGASLTGNCQFRGHSYSGAVDTLNDRPDSIGLGQAVAAETQSFVPSSASKPAEIHRSCSTPPTGTVKADDAASAHAKAKAVAALQRLFFEEMARNGQDANGAAARALRRLSEAPSSPSAPAAQAAPASRVEVAPRAPARDDDEEAPAVEEEAPARRMPAEDAWACMASSGLLAEDMFEARPLAEAAACPDAGLHRGPVVPRRPDAPTEGRRRPCRGPRVEVGA